MTPLATIHFAGEPSFAETHSSRVLPSKRAMASDGASAFVRPGVMMGGTGSHTSVSAGFGAVLDAGTGFCAAAADATTDAMRMIEEVRVNRRMRDSADKEYRGIRRRTRRAASRG